jgi:hypothetical protein
MHLRKLCFVVTSTSLFVFSSVACDEGSKSKVRTQPKILEARMRSPQEQGPVLLLILKVAVVPKPQVVVETFT